MQEVLFEERRARMAAERLLAQKEAELHEANRKLSRHARALSEDLVETRGVVEEVKGENSRVRADLERATEEVDIAKRRLWSSIQSIEDGFAVFDAENRMVVANSAFLLPFDGLECIRPGVHYQEVIEAALAEGVVDIDGKTPAQWREEMLARWFSPQPEPRVIRLWDGTWLRLVDTRAPGGDTVCFGLNITDAMRREAALKDARNKAEAASRAKSAFLANMSHEIRTPMNGVVAMADLLAEAGLDDEQRIYVDTIRNSGQALLAIINDVLDYSKIEADKMVLRPEVFDLERTILDVIQLLQPSIREKRLKVMLDYDMFLPTRFTGDPVRIRQVLTNLMGNAVKFTLKGHVLVRVVGVPQEHGKAYQLHVTVEDTGIGIPGDKLADIFGDFTQVEDDRNRSFEGTGLGLAISKRLVELMGGQIWVESEAGVGSAFGVMLTLPAVDADRAPEVPGWIGRALLVMDDDLQRAILEKRLRALGLEVDLAATKDGAEDDRVKRADVIFASADLADVAGVPFVTRLRDDGIEAPVLIVVAPDLDRRQTTDGAAAVLRRPIPRDELLTALAELPRPATDPAGTAPPDAAAPAQDAVIAPVFGSRRGVPATFADQAAPISLLTPPVAELPDPPVRRMRVLAAEDNKTNQLVFSKLVKNCDIELRFVGNGQDAVDAFVEDAPDLIFMDISMPGMDGKQATRSIREIEAARGLPATRIVALTAHAMSGDAEEILRHGLDRHLTKPLKKHEIYSEIEAACPANARPPLPKDVAAQPWAARA